MNIPSVKLRRLYNSRIKNWLFTKLIIYIVLAGVGFVYLYPIIYMLLHSFLSPADLIDSTVKWIPTKLYFGNYIAAFQTLNFEKSFLNSILTSLIPAILQMVSAAVVGFGLARFNFPLKKMWIFLVITTFIIPSQVTLVPRYVLFYQYKIINTILPAYLPAILGQGIRSALFILVFYQFFSSYPIALDEAAELDGAGKLKIFYKIAIPMAIPAMVLTFLFSFIWYWNETTQFNVFFGSVITTLPMQLQKFTALFQALYGATSTGTDSGTVSDSITLAGTALSILPVIIMYLCFQKQFIESIERTGIAGE